MEQVNESDCRCDSIDHVCSRRSECTVAKALREKWTEHLNAVESDWCKGYIRAVIDNVDAIACYPVVKSA